MTVHNGERYVRDAAASVLLQTLTDLELIVVDDASTDETVARLEGLHDDRLHVLRLERNGGPFEAANRGLAFARAPYVARLDADDLAFDQRLEEQVRFLERHDGIGLLGSGCIRVDERGRTLGLQQVPESDLAIRLRCLIAPPLVHSTSIWRRSLGLAYDARLRVAGDYELWCRALSRTHAANLPEPLVAYREWEGAISARKAELQRALHDEIAFQYLARGWPRLAAQREEHRALRHWAVRRLPGEPVPAIAAPLVEALSRECLWVGPETARPQLLDRALSRVGDWGQPIRQPS
jgi:glycosyltransferase involved in cell wall biosynthesis